MFTSHFLLEFKLRLRSLSTYVYFLIFFLLTFFETSVHDFGPIGTGKVLLNGPYALTLCYVQLTGFGAILIAAIFGPSILRDFQQDTYQLLFTKPISKFDYLGGRWAASLVVMILVLSGLIWGAMVGICMPWADKTRLAPTWRPTSNHSFTSSPRCSFSAASSFAWPRSRVGWWLFTFRASSSLPFISFCSRS
jgi:hypothetical protein